MANGDATPKPELLWYILSFFITILGIIFAIVYMSKPEPEAQTFGRNCLIITVAKLTMSLVGCIFLIIIGALVYIVS
ncbi:MAG: hypothetical protein PVH29_04145 [Candidatus Zixiibacteriota bacterium]|jgi:hypothetical protein